MRIQEVMDKFFIFMKETFVRFMYKIMEGVNKIISPILNFTKNYLLKFIIILSIGTIVWGSWFKYIHKGNFDDIFGDKQIVSILTKTSNDCVGCHGRQSSKEIEVITVWGKKQIWKGFQSTYLDPHVKVKLFNKTTKFELIKTVYAQSYSGNENHPVGIPYKFGDSGYKNPPIFPVIVPYGYIECESCHVTNEFESEEHGMLVTDNNRSNLCLSCHNK